MKMYSMDFLSIKPIYSFPFNIIHLNGGSLNHHRTAGANLFYCYSKYHATPSRFKWSTESINSNMQSIYSSIKDSTVGRLNNHLTAQANQCHSILWYDCKYNVIHIQHFKQQKARSSCLHVPFFKNEIPLQVI